MTQHVGYLAGGDAPDVQPGERCVTLGAGNDNQGWENPGRRKPMAYDLLIRNGCIVDGSGMPPYRGDVAVKDGKILEIGKLGGPATRVVDAGGMVVAPGFIDNHCHYDAQVSWDP